PVEKARHQGVFREALNCRSVEELRRAAPQPNRTSIHGRSSLATDQDDRMEQRRQVSRLADLSEFSKLSRTKSMSNIVVGPPTPFFADGTKFWKGRRLAAGRTYRRFCGRACRDMLTSAQRRPRPGPRRREGSCKGSHRDRCF